MTTNRVIKEIEALDMTLVKQNGHLKFRCNQTGKLLVTSATPSDHRFWENVRRDIRSLRGQQPKVVSTVCQRDKASLVSYCDRLLAQCTQALALAL
jgi:hypothetical protein